MNSNKWNLTLLSLSLSIFAFNAQAAIITFENLQHGTIVNNQYQEDFGLTISAHNLQRQHNIAGIFDSTLTPTRDSDLEDPWSTGNIPTNTTLGKLLIIQENMIDSNEDGLLDYPDDEGRRPAGSLFFDFEDMITSFGFDLVDVETPEIGNDRGYVATFHNNGVEVATVGFGDFIDPLSSFYDPTINYGDNSANKIAPITALQLGVDGFDFVEVNFGGSAAIDNIQFTPHEPPNVEISEPSLLWLLLSGGIACLWWRRKNR
jgi:hypothetical protein